MRSNNANFNAKNSATTKELRLVVKIAFDATTDVFFTSHVDITISGETVVSDVLKKATSASQRIDPNNARATIGNINFELVDVAEAVTDTFRDELTDNDNGLRGKTVELYLGYKDLAWTDYRLEQTQVIDKSVTYIDGIYKVSCRDIQREARKQIFELPKTRLAAAVSVSDSSIDVHDTSGFTLVPHGTSYTLNPSVSIVYFKIKAGDGFEICSATGMTATSFTGVVRGLFGTDNLTHEIGDNESSSPEVTEYIYLEMPAVKLVYALLTGDLIGQGATLPDHYHIGISADWVDIDAFTGIGELYDSSDDTLGLLTRFQGLTKTDGKRFVEQQLLLLAGCVTPVLPNGKLSLKVVGSVLTGAAYVAELNETNIVKYSALNYDLSAIKNQLEIFWSWLELQNGEKDYYRINRVVDLVSIERFGETIEKPLKFLGLHGERHTTSIIDKMFDVFRDRSAGAAARLSLDVLPSMNNIEVGDVVRVSLDALRDHTGLNTFDRAMEVQGITIDQLSQSVKLQLFGSTQQAGIIESGDITTLPDEWYCDEDFTEMTELSTVLTINGSNQVTANGTIMGDNSAPGGGSSTTDYIARWSFDQIVGGGGLGENDLQDGRDLMIVDASDYDPLAPGSVQCLRTTGDGNNDSRGWLDDTDSALFELQTFSVSFWAKRNDAGSGQNCVIACGTRQTAVGDEYIGWRIMDDSSGSRLRMQCFHGGGISELDEADYSRLSSSTAYHYVMVRTPTRLAFYRNGVKVDEITPTESIDYGNGSSRLTVGAWYDEQSSGTYKDEGAHDTDDIRIFDRELSDAEISDLYTGTESGGAGSDHNNAIYYHADDLTINTGVDVVFTGNVQLRIKGHLTINGKLNGKGQGLAASATGQPGYIGSTKPTGGVDYDWPNLYVWTINDVSTESPAVSADHGSFPSLTIVNNAGVLSGLPSDLRGTSGSQGGAAVMVEEGTTTPGGVGGAGGAGIVIVCRGMSYGAAGEIDTSGNDGTAGTITPEGDFPSVRFYSGGGGGGSAGAILILLDGTDSVVPILTGNITTDRGAVVDHSSAESHQLSTHKGFAAGEVDASKIEFIPETSSTYPILTCAGGGSQLIPSVAIAPSSINDVSANGPHTTASVTATPTNITPVSYAWTRSSGSADISITTNNAASTTFSSTGDDIERTTIFKVTATDTNGYKATATISVTIKHGYSVAITPGSLSESAGVGSHTTASVTAAHSNMIAPVTYAWTRKSGSTRITVNTPASATTTFNVDMPATTISAVFTVTATDTNGDTAQTDISVIIAPI